MQWEKPEVKTREEWRQVLSGAADVIERCGWVQGELGDKNIGFCALGAMEEALYGDTKIILDDYSEAIDHFANHIRNFDVVEWNDYKQRTERQVVEALRACANSK